MKIQVPFFKQTSILNCGPTALRMILSYLDKDPGLEKLEKLSGIKEGKGVYTLQLAIASASLGFPAEFYSKQIKFNEANLKLDFYKNYADNDRELYEKLIEKAKDLGIEMHEKSINLDKLLSRITPDSLAVILLDWHVIIDKIEKSYRGHFVPIVGYDQENVYVHNQDNNNPQQFIKIKKELFDKARKAKGTDEDIVLIRRKSKSP